MPILDSAKMKASIKGIVGKPRTEHAATKVLCPVRDPLRAICTALQTTLSALI